MKRYLMIFLSMTLLTFGIPSNSYAATDGCPDTWKIDTTSKVGYDELVQAKTRLGTDLALGAPTTQYLNYSGELGTLAAPKDRGDLTREDVYLYGKTQIQWKIDVQMKNCPVKTTFVIIFGTLSDSLNIKSISMNIDPQAWASANEKSFPDFTKAAQFGTCIKTLQSKFSPPNIGIELQGTTLLVTGLNGRIKQDSYLNSCGIPAAFMGYQDLTPECRSDTESFGRSVAIKKDGSCDLALSMITKDGGLLTFPKYTIYAKDFEVVVTCAKGKLTKKFTTYKGYEFRVKCPAGYKKKL